MCNKYKYECLAYALATARQDGGIRSHQHDEQRSMRRKKYSTPASHTRTLTNTHQNHTQAAARRLYRRRTDAAAAGVCVCNSSCSNSSTWHAAAPRPLLDDRVGYQAARKCPDIPELKHARALTKPSNYTSRSSRWMPSRSLPPQWRTKRRRAPL
jgi:hypothetical protein